MLKIAPHVTFASSSPNCLTHEQILKITEAIEDYEIPISTIPTAKPKPILKKDIK